MRSNLNHIGHVNKGSTAPEVLLLSRSNVEKLFSMGETIKAVEYASKQFDGLTIELCSYIMCLLDYVNSR